MHRLILMSAVLGLTTVLLAGPALAFQCPKLITEINNATGNRIDAAGNSAKDKAAQAGQLHAQGKHAEAEKAAKEGLAMIGIQK